MKHNKLFVLLSLTIFILDISFILINYYYSKVTLHNNMQASSESLYTAFNTELESSYENLLLIASLYAEDRQIQTLFLKGKNALIKEGGGVGGKETAQARQELLDETLTGWNKAKKNFNVRQFHFHLGPGDTSFLRVHKPKKFGDNLDKVRFTIVDTNQEHRARTGFETGRVRSGLRGVVPVFDELEQQFIGTLEIGTAFTSLFKHIDANFNAGIAVLLKKEHLIKYLWPSSFKKHFSGNMQLGVYILDEASRLGADKIIQAAQLAHKEVNMDGQLNFLAIDDKYYFSTFHPFNDYRGIKTGSHTDVGSILIWKDVTQVYNNYIKEQQINIVYGLAAFIVVELLLLLTFRMSHHHLTEKLAKQSNKLNEKEELLKIITQKNKQLSEQDQFKKLNITLVREVEVEVEKNTRQLQIMQQQSKMAQMGEMIGAIAHQWRQPLNVISTGIQNLKYDFKEDKLKDEEYVKEFIDKNKKTINFMSKTIDDFRHFYRIDKDKKSFKIREASQSVIDMQSAQLKNNDISISLSGDDFYYCGLQSEYQQVILNLISNAKDALLERKIAKPIIEITLNDQKISIKDNAGGIEKETIKRVFEPYFTTKDQGKGTGMGLYMSKMIIEDNMGAELRVFNDSDGAVFVIDFS